MEEYIYSYEVLLLIGLAYTLYVSIIVSTL